jgi:hypothetical protein
MQTRGRGENSLAIERKEMIGRAIGIEKKCENGVTMRRRMFGETGSGNVRICPEAQ